MEHAFEVKIDYAAVAHNAAEISSRAGKGIMAVVKNNAYNFGLGSVVGTLLESGVKHFAVTTSEEASSIRRASGDAYVLQLNPACGHEIDRARREGIALAVTGTEWFAENASRLFGIDLHLKVNVGMNRFGVRGIGEARAVTEECARRGLRLTGLFTHFPLAEEDDTAGHDAQVDEFAAVYEDLRWADFRLVHAENSATLLRADKRLGICNLARPGILLYGYAPPPTPCWESLRPSLFVDARVVDLHTLRAGDNLGYGTSFVAESDMRIAVLPIGYGDGLLRSRKSMPAYIDGRPYPVAGGISMSHTYLAVDESVRVGDTVEIYGFNARPDRLAAAGIAANSEQVAALHTGAR